MIDGVRLLIEAVSEEGDVLESQPVVVSVNGGAADDGLTLDVLVGDVAYWLPLEEAEAALKFLKARAAV